MAIIYSTAEIHSLLDKLAADFANGVIEVRTDPRPADSDSAATGTLLGYITKDGGDFTPGSPTYGINFGTAANKELNKASGETWLLKCIATGKATWFRHRANAVDSGVYSTTHKRMDGKVATFGGEMTLSSVDLVAGNTYPVNTVTYKP